MMKNYKNSAQLFLFLGANIYECRSQQNQVGPSIIKKWQADKKEKQKSVNM